MLLLSSSVVDLQKLLDICGELRIELAELGTELGLIFNAKICIQIQNIYNIKVSDSESLTFILYMFH